MAKKSDAKRDAFVSKKLAKMTLEEKVGQLLTFTGGMRDSFRRLSGSIQSNPA